MFTFIVHFLSFWGAVALAEGVPTTFKSMVPSLKNQIFVVLPLSCWFDFCIVLPGDDWKLWKFIIAIVIQDCVFFSVHKVLHLPMFFRGIHSIHHQWVINNALATIDCHWLEMLFGNIVPVVVSGICVNMGLFQWLTWVAFGTCCAVHSHAPNQSVFANHQRHHDTRHQWFGSIGLMDVTLGRLL